MNPSVSNPLNEHSSAFSLLTGADEGAAFDSYISDPAHPVPYRHRPISPTYPAGGWPTWLIEDQCFVDNRPDVLTWQTEPLTNDIKIAGDIVAQIFASTSGTDSDWIVKLIDVYREYLRRASRGLPQGHADNPSFGGIRFSHSSSNCALTPLKTLLVERASGCNLGFSPGPNGG
ncbi:MAG TPA: CocE/NonD family hydrolase C-terminal non-catalytic domain-containing protein [Bryobacteraceae bacterium]